MKELPLKTFLLDTIKRSGPITFERYMGLCLYHPDYGYYTQGRRRTGAAGDYFTSPDLHPIFARLVARQAAEMWEALGRPSRFCWVEMGAGSGLFAQDFLCWVKSVRPDFAGALEYVAIEPGPRQCALLRERLAEAGLLREVRLLENLEQLTPITGCFFSNELVDAFPVAIVTRAGGHLGEIYVSAEGEELREKTGRISNPAIAAAVARYAKQLEEGCRVEVNLVATDWMRSVAGKLDRGFAITIDYGDHAQHLYTDDRPQGTLLAYHRHMPLDDALGAPGEIDLTAHVNFSALIDAGKEAGLELSGFTSQERFLLALGEANQFADLYEPGATELENLRARLKLKRLIHPEGMGNVFKVLVQHRGIDSPRLTGLKYGSIRD
ncbi:MAG: SAM-dependent methyltransferase [Terriglobia bacterium]|jgi:SAM-dependent MidA family methyltransferase